MLFKVLNAKVDPAGQPVDPGTLYQQLELYSQPLIEKLVLDNNSFCFESFEKLLVYLEDRP